MQPRHTITYVSGNTQTVFMSFGLLNTLIGYLGGPENLPAVRMHPEVRETFLVELLSPRDQHGEIPRGQEFNIKTADLTVDEVTDLLEWVEGHLSDFFIKAARSLSNRAAEMVGTTGQSSSATGSKP